MGRAGWVIGFFVEFELGRVRLVWLPNLSQAYFLTCCICTFIHFVLYVLQRWNSIKRRQNNSITKTGSQPSEMQSAARRAFNMAVDKPGLDIPKSASPIGTNLS